MGRKTARLEIALVSVGVFMSSLAEADGEAVRPVPNGRAAMEKRLRNQNLARVGLGVDRFTLVAPRADSSGLRFKRIQDPTGSTLAQPIAWERVQSIELKHSGARNGAVVGFLIGAGVGGAAMAVSSSVGIAPSGDVAAGVVGAAIVATMLTTGLGAAIGSRSYGWRPIYLRGDGPDVRVDPPTAPSSRAAATSPEAPTPPGWTDLARELEDEKRVRVVGDAGTLMVVEPRAGGEGLGYRSIAGTSTTIPPNPLPWSEIHVVEVERNHAAKGILAGLVLGGVAIFVAQPEDLDSALLVGVPVLAVCVTSGALWDRWVPAYGAH